MLLDRFAPIPFLLILFLFCCTNCQREVHNGTLIENISIVDPIKGLTSNQSVLLENGRIKAIRDFDPQSKKKYKSIVNGENKYLIPGLWDAHVHFAYIEELAPRMLDLFLIYGITSVRDTGGKIDFVKKWKERAEENPHTAPRVMIAGPLLDGIPNVYDGSDPSRPPLSVGLDSKAEIEETVKALISEGVDLLKAYEMLTPEQFETITRLGQENGLRVTGHVPLSMDVQSAAEAGLNSIEHLRNIEMSCASNHQELLDQRLKLLYDGRSDPGGILRSRIHAAQRQNAIENYDQEVADKVLESLKKNDVWQIPTLALIHSFVKRPFLRDDFKESFTFLNDSLETSWSERISEISEIPPQKSSYIYNQWTSDMLRQMYEKEIPIMAGTDCPILFLTPGLSLHEELFELVESGMTPLDALNAATFSPSKYFNLENELGLIEENYHADLLILRENPLDDIRNTTSIDAVIKAGHLIDHEAIEALKKKLSSD